MKSTNSYLLIATLGFASILGLGAPLKAQADYLSSASYCSSANNADASSDYFANLAQLYNGTGDEDTMEYYAYDSANSAQANAYNCWLAAPGGSYTKNYAWYAYYYAYYRYYYQYLDWLYDDYEPQAGEAAFLGQLYRGAAMLMAAYRY